MLRYLGPKASEPSFKFLPVKPRMLPSTSIKGKMIRERKMSLSCPALLVAIPAFWMSAGWKPLFWRSLARPSGEFGA